LDILFQFRKEFKQSIIPSTRGEFYLLLLDPASGVLIGGQLKVRRKYWIRNFAWGICLQISSKWI